VQEGTYKRVGSNLWQRTRFRLVCATNRDLQAEEASGRFRRDFYFRIAAAVIRLPPLHERRDDILLLFRWFLADILGQEPTIDPVVADLLLARDYPGNVRDLRQLAVRVANRHVGAGPVTAGDIPEDERPSGSRSGVWFASAFFADAQRALTVGWRLPDIREAAAAAAVQVALGETGGHVGQAARLLGITERALQLRLAHARQKGGGDIDGQPDVSPRRSRREAT
jgi:DNA-binding NtrC family response regulator